MTTGNFNVTGSSGSSFTHFTGGFWWDGVWHEVKPSAGEDDGPPTSVREPRRPRPFAPAGAMALEVEPEMEHA